MPVAYRATPLSRWQSWRRAFAQLTARVGKRLPAPVPILAPSLPSVATTFDPALLNQHATLGTAAHASLYAADWAIYCQQLNVNDQYTVAHFLCLPDLWTLNAASAVSMPVLAQSVLRRLQLFGVLRTHLQEQEFFVQTLRRDAAYLHLHWSSEPRLGYHILGATVSLIAEVCYDAEPETIDKSLNQLYKLISAQFLDNGEHIARNFSLQLLLTEVLEALREVLNNRGLPVDSILRNTLLSSADYLRAFWQECGSFPLFNSTVIDDAAYAHSVLNAIPQRQEALPTSRTGYVQLKGKRTTVVADFGKAPDAVYSHEMHAGLFSFELFSGAQRIITNCGSGIVMGDPWEMALRQSAAHSALLPENNHTTITPAVQCDAFVTKTPSQVHHKVMRIARGVMVEGSHNGWVKHCGITHRRRLIVHADGTVLQGEDWLTRVSANPKEAPTTVAHTFSVRFHLHPDIEPKLIRSGGALLRMPDDRHWVMIPGARPLSIEDSVFVDASGRVRPCKQLVLTGHINRDETKIRWVLQSVRTNDRIAEMLPDAAQVPAEAEVIS